MAYGWYMIELEYEDAQKIEAALAQNETVQIVYGPNHDDPIDIDRIEEHHVWEI